MLADVSLCGAQLREEEEPSVALNTRRETAIILKRPAVSEDMAPFIKDDITAGRGLP